ncbi:MAG TPA: hypothetical protein VFL99_02455 [Segeticoccus sp.]|uniref:hypothetical protein n=1 Tax=Segeticoccus sp. TaxID=2706531 RepID=UPI002D7FD3E7|nr:hypothetical protein [Segeticoccus sp.]HET8599159.1 hypothetical protein [Segeticoccus sp.]
MTGCAKSYVAQFAEAEGFAHTHFHLIPRPADLAEDRRGPNVFGYLGVPEGEQVPAADQDELARRLRTAIAEALGLPEKAGT